MVNIDAKEEELAFIQKKCQEAITDITWDPEANLMPNITLSEAREMAKVGKIFHKDTILRLEPQNAKYAEWMNFVHLLTILYNRNRIYKKYTILRTGCNYKPA